MNTAVEASNQGPVKATWILLIIAWVTFLIPLFGGLVGWPLNLVAFILSIVVMSKGNTVGGLIPLLCSLIVSPLIYFLVPVVLVALGVALDTAG